MEPITIASYSFHKLLERGMIDLFGYLEASKYHYNVDNADIWNGFILSYEEDYLKKIREALDDRGMTLQALCCDWAHPYSDDPDQLKKQNAVAEDCLRAADILGAKTVRFDLGVHTREINEAQYDIVSKAFRAYAQHGFDNGYAVGPENHWGASRRLSVQKELHARVNHPGYATLLHFDNWDLEAGETLEANNLAFAKIAAHTHVSYEVSERSCDLLPKVREAGYKGMWGCEHHTEVDEYRKVALQLGRIRLAKC